MKNTKVEYVDGIKVITYTKERKPRKNERTFTQENSKYSVWGCGAKSETLNPGKR